jgi:hypothetical protein
MLRWQPAQQRTRIKIIECGPGRWDEQDHGLDYPAPIHTIDFKVTGTGHRRIEQLYLDGCAEVGRRLIAYEEKQLEQRIAMWLCQHASGFVMIHTEPRRTVIGLEHHEDAEAFSREFV